MTSRQAIKMLSEIHKNKEFKVTLEEATFLEDMSFYATFGKLELMPKDAERLAELHKHSQEV